MCEEEGIVCHQSASDSAELLLDTRLLLLMHTTEAEDCVSLLRCKCMSILDFAPRAEAQLMLKAVIC